MDVFEAIATTRAMRRLDPAQPVAAAVDGGARRREAPAVQNLFLAARALGLGTPLTTIHQMREAEVTHWDSWRTT